jgi:hypothetical protein
MVLAVLLPGLVGFVSAPPAFASCGFSQTIDWTPFYTQEAGVVSLPPCTGLYVVCYTETNSPGTWTEWVNWTDPNHGGYAWRFSGWVDDIHIQTYGNPPSTYWGHC